MPRRSWWLVVFTSVFTAAILLLTYYLPLTTEEQPVVALHKITGTRLLRAGETLTQKFQPTAGWQSGVVVYAEAPVLTKEKIHVRILDPQGQERARGQTLTASYVESDQVLRLALPTTWFKTNPHERLFLELKLVSGPALSLQAITQNLASPELALSLLHPTTLSFGAHQGVLAGVIVTLLLLLNLLFIPPRWHWRFAGGILLLATLLSLSGFWFSPERLGIADWDYYFSLHDIYRQTILQHHQLPLWNPYTCGGTAALGDPEFPLFTPTFLLELIFGIPVGLRLAIYLAVFTGGLGMLRLAKSLGLSVGAGLVAALVYMFSTVNLLEIVEGHVNLFAAMWLPWLWWSWLRTYRQPSGPRTLLLGLFFALTFLQAGLYLLVYTFLALGLVILFCRHKLRALRLTALAGLWALGLTAIKLVPVLFWLRQFPDQTYATSAFSLPWLVDILFGRHLHGLYLIFQQRSGWHEYGAYLGYFVFFLSLLGLSQIKRHRLIGLLTVIGLTALLLATLGPVLDPVFNFLWFIPRSNISRVIILTVATSGLLAGFGLDLLQRRFKNSALPLLLIGLVAVDLLSLAASASRQAFVLPPVYPAVAPPPAPLAYTTKTFDHEGRDRHQTRTYEATKRGWGSFFHCSVLGPKPRVIPVESADDSGLLVSQPPGAALEIRHWSPNHLTVEVDTARPTVVVLNANYAAGWLVNGQPAQIYEDRVAVTVYPGRTVLRFAYQPPGLRLGLFLTATTLLLTVFLLRPFAK
jgi:hypothetical protein